MEECNVEVDGCLPLLDEISLPPLTGEVLAEVVRVLPEESLDGWS